MSLLHSYILPVLFIIDCKACDLLHALICTDYVVQVERRDLVTSFINELL
jgi:hypothetical protein